MATPFVTSSIAVISNLNESSSAVERKEIVLQTTRNAENLKNIVKTDGVLDLSKLSEIIKEEMVLLPNTTVAELKSKMETDGEIQILNEEKEIKGEDLVATGYILKISNESETKEYVLIVRGDSDGDGKADFQDILKINKHRLKKQTLKGMYLKAGDVTGDGKADFKDILKINKYRLGKLEEL